MMTRPMAPNTPESQLTALRRRVDRLERRPTGGAAAAGGGNAIARLTTNSTYNIPTSAHEWLLTHYDFGTNDATVFSGVLYGAVTDPGWFGKLGAANYESLRVKGGGTFKATMRMNNGTWQGQRGISIYARDYNDATFGAIDNPTNYRAPESWFPDHAAFSFATQQYVEMYFFFDPATTANDSELMFTYSAITAPGAGNVGAHHIVVERIGSYSGKAPP